MAATIPLWALGRHVTSILLVPQQVNTSTGGLTDTTPTRQFFGHLENIELNTQFALENISSMDRAYENMVPIEQGASLTLTEIEKSAGTNLAAAAAFQATYWKYTLARGAQTFVGYGVLESYQLTGAKARVNAQFVLRPIDTGTEVMTYG